MDIDLGATAADLGRGIAAGRIDPADLTDAYLSAIAAHPDGDRIYARTTPDRARAEARAASSRAKSGQRRGPLDGVPISWKDLFDTAGTATESGSLLLKGRVPAADARVLAAATAQGLICLGKTHMTDLAFSGLGLNPSTATPPNAIDPMRAPGGSSSGAAVSVALGLAAAAIGSDTGGSVRNPAAWNGLIGFKTTHGRISLDGVVPLIPRFDTVGPLTRSVEDAALLLAVLEGTRPADLNGASLTGARFLILTDALADVRDAPGAAFETAVGRLAAAGASITEGGFPGVGEALSFSGALYTAEAWATWGLQIEARGDLMFAPIRERFEIGRSVSAADYIRGWSRLTAIRADWAARMAGFDAVLCPTSTTLPPDVARLLSDPAYFTTENLFAQRNTRIGNLMGVCALTLPTAVPMCGISLMGAAGGEERLLRIGAAAERALTI